LRALPTEFRDTVVLREIEDLSYREIADVLDVPIGTVMSRLARGRAMLQRAFASAEEQEKTHGM
ncbi:MAG: sigma factor-like helix-turn-helix DNA-binding protein, partial [Rudaea sp.]